MQVHTITNQKMVNSFSTRAKTRNNAIVNLQWGGVKWFSARRLSFD